MSMWLEAFRREAPTDLSVSVIRTSEISKTGDSEDNGDCGTRADWSLCSRLGPRPAFATAQQLPAHQLAGEAAAVDYATAGWHVEILESGLLVDTCGQPTNPALMEQLAALVRQDVPQLEGPDQDAQPWPPSLLADPAEIVLRGELHEIEAEATRNT